VRFHHVYQEIFDHFHLCSINRNQIRMPFSLVPMVCVKTSWHPQYQPSSTMYERYKDLVTPALSSLPPCAYCIKTSWHPHPQGIDRCWCVLFWLVFPIINVPNDCCWPISFRYNGHFDLHLLNLPIYFNFYLVINIDPSLTINIAIYPRIFIQIDSNHVQREIIMMDGCLRDGQTDSLTEIYLL
jgi:hypothetical protein